MSKRSELMIAEDRAKICELLARGYRSKAEMARIINSTRPEQFHVSSQQIAKDMKVMEDEYMERGLENMEVYRHQALDELFYLLRMYYEGYEKSRISKITVESMKSIDTQDEYDELMEQAELEQGTLEGVHPFGRDGKVKEEYRGEGNPAFLNGAKGVLDSINKIRGVEVNKLALTDPTGTEQYSGIAELMKAKVDELSARKAPDDTDKFLLDAAPDEEEESEYEN